MKPIIRMIEEEGKNLDDIAAALCPKVEYGREKIVRIIKDFLGEQYLIDHAQTLKYDVAMAKLAKKRKPKSQEKIEATTDNGSLKKDESNQQSGGQKPEKHFDILVRLVKKLVDRFGLADVKNALDVVEGTNTGIL